MRRKLPLAALLVAASCALVLVLARGSIGTALAASHREAPLISLDAPADISDFFMFRSYEPGHEGNVVLIMDTNPGEEPSSAPNYYNFDPNVTYRFRIDNNQDGRPNDVIFEVKFTRPEYRGIVKDAGLPLAQVALPPVTSLDGPGSEGLGLRQKYSVTLVKGFYRKELGSGLIAVPSNVGPRTMPDYAALAAQGIHDLGNGVRVFAGQRDDPFYIDLGGLFDTLNLGRTPLPVETNAEDASNSANAFGVDMLSGFNVQEIALEVPASMLTADGKDANATTTSKLGGVAATYRPVFTARGRPIGGGIQQVQRLANPLVNEAIIGTPDKDKWNAVDDQGNPFNGNQENQFLDYFLNPRLALALQLVYGVPAATTGRTDLRDLLLTYNGTAPNGVYSDLLRLDLHTAPTPLANQQRLGPLAHDANGASTPDAAAWPNGRRPIDDVLDVATRVIGGPNYIDAHAGDGVNVNDKPLPAAFPFLATPWDGRDRIHLNRAP
jgi:uncharacterized protein DUF4331